MSTATLATSRSTLADRVFARSLVTDILLVVAGAGLTAIAAQLTVPIWPVPITGQTLAVLIVGSTLGALRGAISLALYAVVGILGLPVFSDASHGIGVLLSPSGGYIVGFVFSAALVGWLAQRTWDRRFLGAVLSFAAGTVVTFLFGLVWLAAVLGTDLQQTLVYGLYPFVIGGVVKAAIAAALVPTLWGVVRRREAGRASADRR